MNQEPQSLDNLVELLQVSKASVSTNARLLEVRGVVEKIQLAGDRRDFYQVAPDARERMLRHMVERALLMTERLEVGLRAAREIRPEVCERFEGLIGFMGRACQEMVCRLEHEHSAGEGSTGVLLPDTNAHEANTHEANVR
jgi:DNA-binding transcriptional regulator GbsR (MarR family)